MISWRLCLRYREKLARKILEALELHAGSINIAGLAGANDRSSAVVADLTLILGILRLARELDMLDDHDNPLSSVRRAIPCA